MTLLTASQIIEHLRLRLANGHQQPTPGPNASSTLQDPAFRTIEMRSFTIPNPPLSEHQCIAAERSLGFRLPSLVRQLYMTIGDGGFGPADGMYGLFHAHEIHGDRTLLSLHREMTVDAAQAFEDLEIATWHWPQHLLLLCDWTSGTSCIDCSSEEAPILRWVPDGDPSTPMDDILIPEAPSLRHWLSAWLIGRSFDDRDNLTPGIYEFANE